MSGDAGHTGNTGGAAERPAVYDAAPLAEDPLDAGAAFHRDHLPPIRALLDAGLTVLTIRLPFAEDKPHRWRREAVAALARHYAPARINAVAPAGPDLAPDRLEATIAFLAANEALTGQLLLVD